MSKIAPNQQEWSIELARKRAGLTQEEVADKLRMSRNSYRKYENGEVIFRTDKAWEFSQIVDIPFDQIIFFKPNYTLSVVLPKKCE
ncbi:helix-turn-helix transcriptional regulator [Enterococcus asini]|uniref:helix-turn-helix transcriptional regulator n=1 Tax=Enterococcus asini TaxID=57732 RepID=UPI0022E86AB6|nr:helix-turn-helix transcriptional regulator [Enterococcus asini]